MADPVVGRLPALALARLALRNLARNRRRTAITASTVAFSIVLLQFLVALLRGIEEQSFDNLIGYQTGHAKVFAAGYFAEREELPLDRTLGDLAALAERVRAVDGVAAAAPELSFQARLSDGREQIPALGVGLALGGAESGVFRLDRAVTSGRYLEPGDEAVLLGNGLAGLFGLGPGDWITVLVVTSAGAYEALDLPVVGLVGTGNPAIDRGSVLVPLALAQRMLGLDGRATEVAVRFDGRREAAVLERLATALGEGGFEVRGWREQQANLMALVESKRAGSGVMVAIFVLLAMVGVTNTILMAAYERTREIGMLMAMGLRASGVRRLFLTEGAMIGLSGAVVGTALALLVVAGLSGGIDFQALYGDVDLGYPVRERVYPAVAPAALIGGVLATVVLSALASVYPAVRAGRERPVEALRHV
ncbi:MAG: ABC transporter permease [Gemmatimonadales bacterium]